MTKNPSFASFKRTYRPWGQVRRNNLIARMIYVMSMTLLGLALLAGIALLIVFAASVAAVCAVAVALAAVAAFLVRTPAKIFVRSNESRETSAQSQGRGLYKARKSGSTWVVY